LVNAGQLAGLVLSQLKQEGAPFIRGTQDGSSLDMRTTVQIFASEYKRAVALDLAHYYGCPAFGWGGTTDSKVLDQQAGIEIALTLFHETLGGSNLIHDLGYMESGLTGSLELLAMCDEVLGWIKGATQGLEISEETLALDLIDEAGPDGHFLETEHTLRHFKEDWYPRLFDRQNYEGWNKRGRKTMNERAKVLVQEILANHKVEPLPAEIIEEVKRVRRRAEEKPG
jgi:trimethylamine--corrinoid protein Co-methyltransferase